MIRPVVALAALMLATGFSVAQEAAPAAAPEAEITIDPSARIVTTSKQGDMLTGFYATQAVIEICSVELEPSVVSGMAADRLRLERALGIDEATGTKAYAQVKADVETTAPDCAADSADIKGVNAVTAIYAGEVPAAAPAAAADPATPPASEGVATPAAPAAPAQ